MVPCIHDAPGREYALTMLESQIQGHIALDATEFVFIHAGVVADGGRAIVIPGLSFSGKTTLVRALVEAGAVYYSDEFAALDENGRVLPTPGGCRFVAPTRMQTITQLSSSAASPAWSPCASGSSS